MRALFISQGMRTDSELKQRGLKTPLLEINLSLEGSFSAPAIVQNEHILGVGWCRCLKFEEFLQCQEII